MTIEAISGVAHMPQINAISDKAGVSGNDFSAWMSRELAALNTQLQAADTMVQDLATGKSTNLHEVMMSLEKTKLSFELAVQVRNKLLEGYHEVMRMQI